MVKITISGKARPVPHLHVSMNGIDCQDDFVEYIDEPLKSKLISGYMRFEIVNNELFTLTEYSAKETLLEEELQSLVKETTGQWSDGIGEGFEQTACLEEDGEEFYIEPWYYGQKTSIKQI